jgi:hypothetical protein
MSTDEAIDAYFHVIRMGGYVSLSHLCDPLRVCKCGRNKPETQGKCDVCRDESRQKSTYPPYVLKPKLLYRFLP